MLATLTLVVVVVTLVFLLRLRRSTSIVSVSAGRATIRGTIAAEGEPGACVLRVTPDRQEGAAFRVVDGTGSVDVDAAGVALLPLWTELRVGDEVLLTGRAR